MRGTFTYLSSSLCPISGAAASSVFDCLLPRTTVAADRVQPAGTNRTCKQQLQLVDVGVFALVFAKNSGLALTGLNTYCRLMVTFVSDPAYSISSVPVRDCDPF